MKSTADDNSEIHFCTSTLTYSKCIPVQLTWRCTFRYVLSLFPILWYSSPYISISVFRPLYSDPHRRLSDQEICLSMLETNGFTETFLYFFLTNFKKFFSSFCYFLSGAILISLLFFFFFTDISPLEFYYHFLT